MYVNLYVCFCPPHQRTGVLMQPQDRKVIPHEASEEEEKEEEEEAVDGLPQAWSCPLVI